MGAFTSGIFILLTLFVAGDVFAQPWSPQESLLYERRQFVELQERLVLRGESGLADEMGLQSDDLMGCHSLHRGKGNIRQVVQCMRFLNRQKKLGFGSKGTQLLVQDINIICRKLVGEQADATFLMESGVFSKKDSTWRPCQASLWEQVYLTAYANFDANPVSTLAFIRKAENMLPFDKYWTLKAIRLADSH